ncbi:hypothetical protein GCM10011511_15670 [Puia dinghuensis]|uniref:Uncharacterized protein n=1 Tax=Puia dinghuensis TaxID=1792502 RepID=A0A8J2XSS9_9BACT|nr:hypothetical protein GCM10011511_15670 [Puia dinghuensis]
MDNGRLNGDYAAVSGVWLPFKDYFTIPVFVCDEKSEFKGGKRVLGLAKRVAMGMNRKGAGRAGMGKTEAFRVKTKIVEFFSKSRIEKEGFTVYKAGLGALLFGLAFML